MDLFVEHPDNLKERRPRFVSKQIYVDRGTNDRLIALGKLERKYQQELVNEFIEEGLRNREKKHEQDR